MNFLCSISGSLLGNDQILCDNVKSTSLCNAPVLVRRSDVNFASSTVRVSHKPDRGWTPKAYKEREIPIPAKLVKKLEAWKAESDKTCGLVFPTAGGKPKLDFLNCLKVSAERGKLDKTPSGCTTFARHLRLVACGRGLICVQFSYGWGNSDVESTMRYMKPS